MIVINYYYKKGLRVLILGLMILIILILVDVFMYSGHLFFPRPGAPSLNLEVGLFVIVIAIAVIVMLIGLFIILKNLISKRLKSRYRPKEESKKIIDYLKIDNSGITKLKLASVLQMDLKIINKCLHYLEWLGVIEKKKGLELTETLYFYKKEDEEDLKSTKISGDVTMKMISEDENDTEGVFSKGFGINDKEMQIKYYKSIAMVIIGVIISLLAVIIVITMIVFIPIGITICLYGLYKFKALEKGKNGEKRRIGYYALIAVSLPILIFLSWYLLLVIVVGSAGLNLWLWLILFIPSLISFVFGIYKSICERRTKGS